MFFGVHLSPVVHVQRVQPVLGWLASTRMALALKQRRSLSLAALSLKTGRSRFLGALLATYAHLCRLCTCADSKHSWADAFLYKLL